jgi:hypothetical protein
VSSADTLKLSERSEDLMAEVAKLVVVEAYSP